VSSDDEAVRLMNDSRYGLTASIWTDTANSESELAFLHMVDKLETGTVFLNRYLPSPMVWIQFDAHFF
jgi:acyl-CoA reductase-like NAD-dependent aldehyde dehydrogenase